MIINIKDVLEFDIVLEDFVEYSEFSNYVWIETYKDKLIFEKQSIHFKESIGCELINFIKKITILMGI